MMDILVTSASRPECLKLGIESLGYLYCNEGFSIHLHEDVVPGKEQQSSKLIKWAEESNKFTTIYVSNPRIGRGQALNKLRIHAQSDYIIYLEEDWEFIKPVNLDFLLSRLKKNTSINQVCFYDRILRCIEKPGGPEGVDVFKYVVGQFQFNGFSLFVSERWNWLPAIWFTDWVKKRWKFKNHTADKEFNRSLKANCGLNEWDINWLENKIGAYIYSDNDEYITPYVRHTSKISSNRFFDRGFR